MSVDAAGAERPELSIVLPVYNQRDHLTAVVRSYVEVLDRLGRTYEIVLVPNNCSDGSEDVCAELSEADPRVVTVALDRPGWGRAVLAGLQASTGEMICYTNLARTTPEVLTVVVAYSFAYPASVVKASRKIRESRRRRLGSLLYNLECRWLFDLAVWDVNGTPKIFPRSFSLLLEMTRTDDVIDAEFNMRCRRAGYPVVDVPTFSARRHSGRSTTNYRSALHMYIGALELRFQEWRTFGRR